RLLSRLETQRDAVFLRQRRCLSERVEEGLPAGVARLGDEAAVQHEAVDAQRARARQAPLQRLEALGAGGGIAEAACFLDGLWRRVVLTGEAEHRRVDVEAGGLRHFGHVVAL